MASRLKRNKKVIGETLSILDANAGHLSQTSRATEIPATTILGWRESYQNDPVVERYRRLKNEELADRFRVVAAKAIERLNHEIEDVSVDKLATVAAISTDKQLLLTGNATSISSTKSSQLDSARQSYILTAISELSQLHPNMPSIQLQAEAERQFEAWYQSLNIDPLASNLEQ